MPRYGMVAIMRVPVTYKVGVPLTVVVFGFHLAAWFAEQAVTAWLGEAWARLPWGWLTLLCLAVLFGFFLEDLFNPRSWIRAWWRQRTAYTEVIGQELQASDAYHRATKEIMSGNQSAWQLTDEEMAASILIRVRFRRPAKSVRFYIDAPRNAVSFPAGTKVELSRIPITDEPRDFVAGEEIAIPVASQTPDAVWWGPHLKQVYRVPEAMVLKARLIIHVGEKRSERIYFIVNPLRLKRATLSLDMPEDFNFVESWENQGDTTLVESDFASAHRLKALQQKRS